ncbi:hypothetical protein PSPO01_15317 [Paraphaeosphaeria sporulosa]
MPRTMARRSSASSTRSLPKPSTLPAIVVYVARAISSTSYRKLSSTAAA